jgi:NitT/TauT family transport system ATP-binding protein
VAEAQISARNVSKSYFDEEGNPIVEALKEFSLDISENSFVTLLGPSGCGKTTLLRMLAGIEAPSRGEIIYKGRRIDRINTDVGYVPQGRGLFPWMTLGDNIELPLKIRGIDAATRRDLAHSWIDRVGLAGFEDRYPWQLSGGMEKRGSLVRALISNCAVNLMDEPFGPLDAQTRLILQNDLLRLWSENRSIIIFVTHDLVEAVALSDLIVIFSRRPGRIKRVIPVAIPRPRNVFEIFHASQFNVIYDEVREALRDEIAVEG